MTDSRIPRDAVTKRGHEAGVLDERRRQLEDFDLVATIGIDATRATAKAIDHGNRHFVHRREHSDHGATALPCWLGRAWLC